MRILPCLGKRTIFVTASLIIVLLLCGPVLAAANDEIQKLEQDLSEKTRTLGKENLTTLEVMHTLGVKCYETGKKARAKYLLEDVSEIRKRVLGYEHTDTLKSLSYLAFTYNDMGEYNKASNLLENILPIYQRTLGLEHPDSIEVLSHLAYTLTALGKYSKAKELSESALDLRQRILGYNHPDTLVGMNNLASIYYYVGEYSKAKGLLEKALELHLNILGQEHHGTLTIMNTLATVYGALDEHSKALDLQEKVLEFRQRIFGPEHMSTLTVMNNLALTHIELGNHTKAKELLEKVVEVRHRLFGQQHPETLPMMYNLATSLDSLGEYTKALGLFEKTLDLYQRIYGVEHSGTQSTMNNLASLYGKIGENVKAKKLQEKLLEIRQRTLGKNHPSTLRVMSNLAATLVRLESWDKAKDLLVKGLEICERILGPEHPDTLTIMHNLASAYLGSGEHTKSKELYVKVVGLRQHILGSNHPDTLESMNALSAYFAFTEPKKAEQLQDNVLLSHIRNFDINHPDLSLVFANYAELLLTKNHNNSALFYYILSVKTGQYQRAEQVQQSMDTQLQSSYLKSIESRYHKLAKLLINIGRLEDAQAVLELLKIDELSDITNTPTEDNIKRQEAWRGFVTKQETTLIDEYTRLAGVITDLNREKTAFKAESTSKGLTPKEKERHQEIEKEMALAEKNFQAFLDRLPEALAIGVTENIKSPQKRENLGRLRTILRGLEPGTALVQTLSTESTLYVFLTTEKKLLLRSSPIGRKELEQLVANLHAQLRSPSLDPRPIAQQLYTAIIKPFESDLKEVGTHTLMFSLDGALRYIPMSTLFDGKNWLAEQYAVAMFTEAARDRLLDTPKLQANAVGFGVTRKHGEFSPLPGVADELSGIIKVAGNSQGILPGKMLLDGEFTYKSFVNNLKSGTPVMHLASHFQFNPVVPNQSFLLLGDGEKLLLSDLANSKELSFDGIQQLTLSACETVSGLGRGDGREIEGFGALVQRQGALSVIATLWPIADASTSRLMQEFYRQRFVKGQNKAEALRMAQVSLMKGSASPQTTPKDFDLRGKVHIKVESQAPQWKEGGYSHPFYWAPFILLGNWK